MILELVSNPCHIARRVGRDAVEYVTGICDRQVGTLVGRNVPVDLDATGGLGCLADLELCQADQVGRVDLPVLDVDRDGIPCKDILVGVLDDRLGDVLVSGPIANRVFDLRSFFPSVARTRGTARDRDEYTGRDDLPPRELHSPPIILNILYNNYAGKAFPSVTSLRYSSVDNSLLR